MKGRMETFDLTIVGGGPAGLYSAFYGGLREMSVKLIEARHELGGRLLTYGEKVVWDVGGVPPIRCAGLVENMVRQARTFEPTIALGQRIEQLERQEDGTMVLVSSAGERHCTRALILAIGHGVPGPAKLEIEGAERYESTNLHYAANVDLDRMRGKKVLLSRGAGSSHSARLDVLSAVASRVIVVSRRDPTLMYDDIEVQNGAVIEQRVPFVIDRLHGDGERIEAVSLVRIEDNGDIADARERIDVDEVIVDHGTRSEYGPILSWGLEKSAWNFDAGARLETRLPGVFLAGDAANYPSKLHLIAGAIADAALAVNGAKQYLDPSSSRSAPMSTGSAKLVERNIALGFL